MVLPRRRAADVSHLRPLVLIPVAGLSLALILCVAVIAAAQPAAGWSPFRDGLVEMRHPPGWQIQRDADTGRLVVQGTRGERLVVWPFFLDGTLDGGTAGRMLAQMAARQAPDRTWGPVQGAGPTAVRADGRGGADVGVTVLTWTPTARGTAGQFVLAIAPAELRRQSETTFSAILSSVRLTGRREPSAGRGAPARPSVTFVPFQDPNEGAYSLDVPQGWRVSGGLVRKAPVDVRSQVLAASPDNQIQLRIGDADLPPFTVPTPLLAQTGFREGSWYSPGYGVQMQVFRYLGGEQFAAFWVNTKVSGACGNLKMVGGRPLPQTVQAMNAIMARHGSGYVRQRLDAGDVAFRCQQGPMPMAGYLFVATLATGTADGAGTWNVDQLQGYLAATERAGEAQAILAHMVESVRLNPAWVRMQQNITGNVSSIVSETGAHVSKVISDSYWSRQAGEAEMSRRRSNQILGVEDLRDPATGRELKVESGSSYYWIDPRGNVAGTNTDNRPNLEYRELIRLP
jgi:hypothetical protein